MNTKVMCQAAFAFVLLLTSCSKEKTDVRAGSLPSYDNMAKSTIRLIGGGDLMVNGQKLTNWYSTPLNSPILNPPYPTSYFPATGKLNGTWYLPQQFLDNKGQATIKTGGPQGANMPDFITDSFTVQDDYNHPIDYYLGTSAQDKSGIYQMTAVPRGAYASADPTHVRIRLVNLCPAAGSAATGTLSLAYADGSKVSDVTSGVANHAWSDYIELPYGTYQFKVLIDGGNVQIPGKTPMLTSIPAQDDYSYGVTQVYYAPVQTFQSGGVYTVAVTRTSGAYQFGEYPLFPNCFSVITDIDPPVNITYGHIQVVNAMSENGMNVQVDGAAPTSLAYGVAGNDTALIKGAHTIRITDASGKLLTEKNVQLTGGDNLTLWAYPTAAGAAALTVMQNNMGGVRNMATNVDGSDISNKVYNPLDFNMVVQTRFLNLCPELPYVTFTQANGALFTEGTFSAALAAQNLQPGLPADPVAVPYPYIDLRIVSGGTVQAYRSQPRILPGDRLTGVPALTSADFVHMPSFFFHNGGYGAEAGVYTVALIGHSNATRQPPMIIIKHNQ